jgi:hypothetical protein
MLLYQNDYVIIDVDKTEYTNIEQTKEFRELIFDFTVQCNWKIRRHRFSVSLCKDDNTASYISKNWRDIENYNIIYNSFRLLKDLWYDVPTDESLNPLIQKTMDSLIS